MNRYLKLTMLLLASWTTTQAQNEPQKFSLQGAVEYAKKNNYTLKNNQLDVMAAEKKVKEVLSSGLPQINASGNYTNNITVPSAVINFNGIAQRIQFGNPYAATGSISASQLIFDGGLLLGIKASKEYVTLSKLNVNRNEIETEVNVSKAYYMALLVQTNISLIDTNLKTIEKAKSDLEKIYKNGLADKTDLDRLTLQYSTLQLQRDKVGDLKRVSIMVLKLQMGMPINDSIILTDKLDELYKNMKPPVVEAKIDYLKRPEYQLVKQQITLNNYNKKRYQMGYTPSLSAFFTHQQNSFGTTFSDLGKTWYPGTMWGLNLSIPIFDGLRKSSQIQQVKIDIQKAENDMKNLENLIDQQVFQSKMAFERSNQQLKIQEQNMQLAQEIYNRVNIKYQNGLGSSFELTSAQGDLETARNNYLTNMYDYFVAQLDLKKAIGDFK